LLGDLPDRFAIGGGERVVAICRNGFRKGGPSSDPERIGVCGREDVGGLHYGGDIQRSVYPAVRSGYRNVGFREWRSAIRSVAARRTAYRKVGTLRVARKSRRRGR
jgi:hypothetical protein